MRDVDDAPARRPQREDVARARLVDHLLVELADASARTPLLPGEEDAEEPAVGDRAAAGDGDALRARAAHDRARVAIPDHARAQLDELVARVDARDEVERGVERAAGQLCERRRAPHGLEPVVDDQLVHRGGGDRLLREHVERVARHPDRLELAARHAAGDHGRVQQVGAVLRDEHAARGVAHGVAGAAHALQPARGARRRLDLHDEIDLAHVDAELEARRRDDAAQPARLQLVLDLAPLLLRHRAVVRARERRRLRVGAARLARGLALRETQADVLGHVAQDDAASRAPRRIRPYRPAVGGGIIVGGARLRLCFRRVEPLRVELVEPGGEPLGGAPRVDEHDRRAVPVDELEHLALDVRPDRLLLGLVDRAERAAGPGASLRRAQVGHVVDRHGDRELDALVARRVDDGDGLRSAEEGRHLVDRTHRRREPDALRGLGQQRVEPLEAEGQVRAPLRGHDRVHLVDDHGLDGAERLAGAAREQQEQRLRSRDQDVGRMLRLRPALILRRVARAEADADRRRLEPVVAAARGDAGERRPQVAVDVDGERLERRDVEGAHAGLPLGVRRGVLAVEPVDRPEEGGERLA